MINFNEHNQLNSKQSNFQKYSQYKSIQKTNLWILKEGALSALIQKQIMIEEMQEKSLMITNQQSQSHMVNQLYTYLQQLQDQIAEKKQESKRIEEKYTKQLERKYEQCILLNQQVNKMQEAFDLKQAQVEYLLSKIKELQDENHQLSYQLSSTKSTIRALQDSLNQKNEVHTEEQSIQFYNQDEISQISNQRLLLFEKTDIDQIKVDQHSLLNDTVDGFKIERKNQNTPDQKKLFNQIEGMSQCSLVRDENHKISLKNCLRQMRIKCESNKKLISIQDCQSQFTSNFFKYQMTNKRINSYNHIEQDSKQDDVIIEEIEQTRLFKNRDQKYNDLLPKQESTHHKIYDRLFAFAGGLIAGIGLLALFKKI